MKLIELSVKYGGYVMIKMDNMMINSVIMLVKPTKLKINYLNIRNHINTMKQRLMNKNNTRNAPYKPTMSHNNNNFNGSTGGNFQSNNFNNLNSSNNLNGSNSSNSAIGFNDANGFNDTNGSTGSNFRSTGGGNFQSTGGNFQSNNQANNFKEKYQNRNRETNQDLIKYIYATIDISQFKYDLLKYEHQLNKFLTDTYYVSPNFYGKNCFLVFTKVKTKYYSFLIDRKQLSYSFDKVHIDNVYIHHCNVDIDLSIYSGTIFDGVYIKKGNSFEFIITDVYCFKGTDYTGTKLKHKLYEIEVYLDNIGSQFKFNKEKSNNRTNLELKINKLYDVTNIRQFIENDIKIYQEKYQIRGTCFYPEMSGTKLIYLFENNENYEINGNGTQQNFHNKQNDKISDSVETQTHTQTQIQMQPKQSYQTNRQQSQPHQMTAAHPMERNEMLKKSQRPVKTIFVAKTNEQFNAILGMRATKIADNYSLFAVEQVKNGEKTVLRKYPMDIAYIPDINKSNWCKKIMTDSQKDVVFVKCVWRHDKGKWEPLELKDVKIPSLMEDIREYLTVIEESDSDSDDE